VGGPPTDRNSTGTPVAIPEDLDLLVNVRGYLHTETHPWCIEYPS
jgi:hypothetical protein